MSMMLMRGLRSAGIPAQAPWLLEIVSVQLINRSFSAAPNQLALIKQLRDQTGAPISDVKVALQQAEWDLEKASQELRKKGLAAASKKASRHAAEGLVGLAVGPSAAAVVEINSETDFVARNDQFRQLIGRAAAAALNIEGSKSGELDVDALQAAKLDDGTRLADAVADVAGIVRENIRLRRGYRLCVPQGSEGFVGSYVHAGVAPGLGRIAAVVVLEHSRPAAGVADETALKDLAHKLALHVVGAVPQYLDRSQVPESVLSAERALLTEQAGRTGKPAAIVEKMVQGRLNKFYESVCLLEQPYIMEDTLKVRDVVSGLGKAAGARDLRLTRFLRCQVGEGLEAENTKDFAEEVAETLKNSL